MGRVLTISVQGDLTQIIDALAARGHKIITNHEISKETSVFIMSNVDEDWEQIKSLEWIDFGNNEFILTMNASKLTEREIIEVIDRLASKSDKKMDKVMKIKVSVDESLKELRALLEKHGYEVIPSYKVDHDVSAIVFTGVDEIWETISTCQMREYGDSKYVLTMNASHMSNDEILDTLNRLCSKKS
ncbi:hypothetical protein HNQ80_001770 [Anaerosolibacter carboniphilus]|uniref:Uncharacterized protein n=1 Tax=Anaerosolibacter carboniphilus TaxID=1417629 RepID=A0A841KQQ7_9FIRM|nr:YkuS family protein [Anaerosolibacter carboniphilus]MBB6215681.1 hypothetical protein [Anaerosolibacter carboniphilus]